MNPEIQAHSEWTEANQVRLTAELLRVGQMLESHHSSSAQEPSSKNVFEMYGDSATGWELSIPDAVSQLCRFFMLSTFERDIVLLCAGIELQSSFREIFENHSGDRRATPTFGYALSAFPDAHWSAVSPSAPLRYWNLIDIDGSGDVTDRPIRINERILHFLTGVNRLDEHLFGFVCEVPLPSGIPVPSHSNTAAAIVAVWQQQPENERIPTVQLCGTDDSSKRAVAALVCSEAGLSLSVLNVYALPIHPGELDTFIRLWDREAILGSRGIIIECGSEKLDAGRMAALERFADTIHSAVFLSTHERLQSGTHPWLVFDVAKPARKEQYRIWQGIMGDKGSLLDDHLKRISAHFDLTVPDIRAVYMQTDLDSSDSAEEAGERLWEQCRLQVRRQLSGLAQCKSPAVSWDELVLPEMQKHTLYEILTHVKHRHTVYEEWGFENKSQRGLGITALFSGPSGTGKTMAAEVLAHELHLDLFHIDLSQVVSKYIGETEKHLRSVFDAAEASGAVLLFDEADALFGRRSEVKDSHDRYANIEVSYLLQRMEAFRGLAILTTNLKSGIDDAFQRRIRFMVSFPFPDVSQRSEIWKRIFPSSTPLNDLAYSKLGMLNATGGTIHQVALHAAFLAADRREPVSMEYILRATRSVYARLEKTLTESEIKDWV